MSQPDDRLAPQSDDDRPPAKYDDLRPKRGIDPDPPPRKTNTVLIVLLVLGGLTVLGVLVVVGFMSTSVAKVRDTAARAQSRNNLKEMCLGIHQMVSPTDSPMPPATGNYPRGGPNATIFFHILSSIEQDNVYQFYKTNPVNGPASAFVTMKTYCAPDDPTNPGVETNLTSYAANAWLFGHIDGGSTRLSVLINGKGTSNSIMFMERYAQPTGVTGAFNGHQWADNATIQNVPYVFMNNFTNPILALPNNDEPVFGVVPANITNAQDLTAHSFSSKVIQVGLGDGSAKILTTSMNTTNTSVGVPAYTTWRWAVSASGLTAQAPVPPTW